MDDRQDTGCYARWMGNPYLHDRRAIYVHDSKTPPEPHTQKPIFETLVCVVLVLFVVRFAWWTMVAELCFSVDDFILDFFSNTANIRTIRTSASHSQQQRSSASEHEGDFDSHQ